MKTLILIDIQNDFMPTGNLPVPKGDRIIPYINTVMSEYDLIIATQDWHPPQHHSFASNHLGKKPFEAIQDHGKSHILWPDHCVQGTGGAAFHPALNTQSVQAIFRKGMNPLIDSYSAFYDNDHQTRTGIAGFLRDRNAHDLYFCGLCQEICVAYSIQDALNEGFQCTLLAAGSCILNPEQWKTIEHQLRAAGMRMA